MSTSLFELQEQLQRHNQEDLLRRQRQRLQTQLDRQMRALMLMQ